MTGGFILKYQGETPLGLNVNTRSSWTLQGPQLCSWQAGQAPPLADLHFYPESIPVPQDPHEYLFNESEERVPQAGSRLNMGVLLPLFTLLLLWIPGEEGIAGKVLRWWEVSPVITEIIHGSVFVGLWPMISPLSSNCSQVSGPGQSRSPGGKSSGSFLTTMFLWFSSF